MRHNHYDNAKQCIYECRQVSHEQAATQFGRGLLITSFLANALLLGTRSAWESGQNPRACAGYTAMRIGLSIIYGRLLAIPTRYRVIFNIITFTGFFSRLTWPAFTHSDEVCVVLTVTLVAELVGYTFAYQQRMVYHSANEVLRKVYGTMRGTIALESKHPGHEGVLVWIGGATERLLGYTHRECMLPNSSVNAELNAQIHQVINTIQNGDPAPMIVLKFRNRQGSEVMVQTDKTSRILPNGNALLVVHDVTSDIVSRKRTQQRHTRHAIAERFQSCSLSWVAHQAAATVDILVVDDSKLNRMSVVHAAKKLGLSYHEAADGTEALERIRHDKYSVILMDYQMLPMNGADAAEKAREEGYKLPIVMISGSEFDERAKALLSKRDLTACMHKIAVPGPRQVLKRLAEMKEISSTCNVETEAMDSLATGDVVSESCGRAPNFKARKRKGDDIAGLPKKKCPTVGAT